MEQNRTEIIEGKMRSNIRETSNRPAPIKPPTFGKRNDSKSIWTPAITIEDVPANREFVLGNSSLWVGPMICYFGNGVWWRDDGTELAHPPQEWISFDRIFSATGKKGYKNVN